MQVFMALTSVSEQMMTLWETTWCVDISFHKMWHNPKLDWRQATWKIKEYVNWFMLKVFLHSGMKNNLQQKTPLITNLRVVGTRIYLYIRFPLFPVIPDFGTWKSKKSDITWNVCSLKCITWWTRPEKSIPFNIVWSWDTVHAFKIRVTCPSLFLTLKYSSVFFINEILRQPSQGSVLKKPLLSIITWIIVKFTLSYLQQFSGTQDLNMQFRIMNIKTYSNNDRRDLLDDDLSIWWRNIELEMFQNKFAISTTTRHIKAIIRILWSYSTVHNGLHARATWVFWKSSNSKPAQENQHEIWKVELAAFT